MLQTPNGAFTLATPFRVSRSSVMPDAWVPAWPAQKALLAIVARIAGSSEHATAAEAGALSCPRCGPTEGASLPDCLESAEFKAALASPGSLYFHYPAAGSDEAAAWAADAGSAPPSPGVAATQAMILECLSPSKRRAGAGGTAVATRFSMLAEAPLSPLCFDDAAGGAGGRDSLASLASADTATEAGCGDGGRARDSILSAYDASREEREAEEAEAAAHGAHDEQGAAATVREQHSSRAPTPAPIAAAAAAAVAAAAAEAAPPSRGSPPGSEAEASPAPPADAPAAGTSLPSAAQAASGSTVAPVPATAGAQGSSGSSSPACFATFLGLMLLLVLVMQALSGRQEAASPAANSGISEL
jgi:hypothetical protein